MRFYNALWREGCFFLCGVVPEAGQGSRAMLSPEAGARAGRGSVGHARPDSTRRLMSLQPRAPFHSRQVSASQVCGQNHFSFFLNETEACCPAANRRGQPAPERRQHRICPMFVKEPEEWEVHAFSRRLARPATTHCQSINATTYRTCFCRVLAPLLFAFGRKNETSKVFNACF